MRRPARPVNLLKILRQNNAALLIALALFLLPATARPAVQGDFRVTTGGTGLELDSAASKSPVAKPSKPSSVAEKKATEVTCNGETTFDAKASLAVFIKDVKVNDPQFSLSADKLTAYLKKAVKEPVKSGDTALPAPTPEAKSANNSPASGLERAVAEGNVIIVQDRVDEKTGETTHYIGKGAKAEYNAVTGEMTLSGWPQILQGENNQVATDESTVMIMDRDGHLRTKGPSMTVIKSDAKPSKTP